MPSLKDEGRFSTVVRRVINPWFRSELDRNQGEGRKENTVQARIEDLVASVPESGGGAGQMSEATGTGMIPWPSCKHVGNISAMLPLHRVDPRAGAFIVRSRCLLINPAKRGTYGRGHILSIPADKDGGALRKQCGDLLAFQPDFVLNEPGTCLRAVRVSRHHFDHTASSPFVEFFAIKKVNVGIIDSEEEQRLADVFPCCFCSARSCRKPRNGAIPEPAQIRIIGRPVSAGGRKCAFDGLTATDRLSPC